jgi:hypothetical protein
MNTDMDKEDPKVKIGKLKNINRTLNIKIKYTMWLNPDNSKIEVMNFNICYK